MSWTKPALGGPALAAVASAVLAAGACSLDEGSAPSVDGGVPVLDAFPEAVADVRNDVVVDADASPDAGDAADAAPTFTPATLSGLELWLKADQGLVLDGGGALGWLDQSGKNDPARNASVGTFSAPTVVDAGFGPALYFDVSQGLHTGRWDGGLAAPISVFVVAGKDPKPPTPAYLFDSVDYSSQLSVLVGVDNVLRQYAGAYGTPAQGAVSKPMAVLAVFNGASSFLLRNANHGDAGGSSPGANNTTNGFTIGNYAPNGLGFGGYIAEFAVYSRVLADPEIASLNAYAAQRYGVVIQ